MPISPAEPSQAVPPHAAPRHGRGSGSGQAGADPSRAAWSYDCFAAAERGRRPQMTGLHHEKMVDFMGFKGEKYGKIMGM